VTLDPDLNDLGSLYRCEPILESASPARTAKKLLRKKKNESWAMRPAMAEQTSPTLGVGGNLLCEIAQYVL